MITIPIYVNGTEQAVCELTDRRIYVGEKFLENHTLTPDQMVNVQNNMWREYISGDKLDISITRIDYSI